MYINVRGKEEIWLLGISKEGDQMYFKALGSKGMKCGCSNTIQIHFSCMLREGVKAQ